MGYCSDGWWLNQQFCCWEIEGGDEDTCEAWHQWSDVMPARWAIYVLFAVRIGPLPNPSSNIDAFPGCFLLRCCTPSAVTSEVRRGVRDIRNQVHYRGVHHEGFPGLLDTHHQECDAGTSNAPLSRMTRGQPFPALGHRIRAFSRERRTISARCMLYRERHSWSVQGILEESRYERVRCCASTFSSNTAYFSENARDSDGLQCCRSCRCLWCPHWWSAVLYRGQ